MKHWWDDTDSRKPTFSEKNLSQCHVIHEKFYIDLGSNLGFRNDRPATSRLEPWHWLRILAPHWLTANTDTVYWLVSVDSTAPTVS
jgi:hypothetical protein